MQPPVQPLVQRGVQPPVQRPANLRSTGVRHTPLIPLALHAPLGGGARRLAPSSRRCGMGETRTSQPDDFLSLPATVSIFGFLVRVSHLDTLLQNRLLIEAASANSANEVARR